MMRSLSVGAVLVAGLFTVPIDCEAATVKKCPGRHVIMASADASPTNKRGVRCDVRPPQVLSYWMDDPGPIQIEACLDSGGTPTVFRDRELCYRIDY